VDEAPDARDQHDLAAIRAGERERFRGLVERHGPRVYDLARRLTRDAHLAEDVTQQAFQRAWEALARFDASRPFRHWILRITTNLCRNLHARRTHRRERPGGPGGTGDPQDEPVFDPPDPRGPTAQAGAGDDPALPAQDVRAAIDRLAERYRAPVVLHHLHGLPLEVVAEILDLPLATLKTHLFRGRQALKTLLLGPETTPPPTGTTARPPRPPPRP
jgi:RNA polymerase sigma-70 factor (ECF subfamily)